LYLEREEVKLIDYTTMYLPDSCYADIEHLNYRGAEVFSSYLKKHLASDLK
jgi:hypothetical protein